MSENQGITAQNSCLWGWTGAGWVLIGHFDHVIMSSVHDTDMKPAPCCDDDVCCWPPPRVHEETVAPDVLEEKVEKPETWRDRPPLL